MANIKWKCNNCEPNHYFEGDKFTSECPNCKSENIEQLKEDKFVFYLKYLQDNWKIVLPVILCLFFLLLWLNRKPDLDNNTIYIVDKIEQKPGTNYLEISMIGKDTVSGKKEVLSESKQIEMISEHIRFLTITGENKQIIPIGNKVYLCYKDTTDGNSFNIVYKRQVVPEFRRITNFEFHLNGIQPDFDKADCETYCITSDDIKLMASKCKLIISVKNILPNKSLFVSVDGIDGEYKQQLVWDIKPIKKYDVWVKYDKCLSVDARENGGTPPDDICKECKENELSEEFSELLNNWGQAPNDMNLVVNCIKFFKKFKSGKNKLFVNGIPYSNWSDMEQDITTQNLNYSKTFKLAKPVKIMNDCTEVIIEFIYD